MLNKIRNFCILAHIDHGKSTLADRFLEITLTVSKEKLQPQFLDTNPISRERGITIKLAPARMTYELKSKNRNLSKGTIEQTKNNFIFNLIDTPGHVDFSYEVSRALAACEGAILLVDATQGIQAQTLSYYQKAKDQNLAIIPVVNKIDVPSAEPENTALDLIKRFNFGDEEILFISAKTGEGVPSLLERVIERIPPPTGQPGRPLRALVFDSFYDNHKGVIAVVRVVDGEIKKNTLLKLYAGNTELISSEIGYFTPLPVKSEVIENGGVGYIATGLKDISKVRVGDTLMEAESSTPGSRIWQPLQGYQEPKPMVFIGVYPVDQEKYLDLKEAIGKLKLNDASLQFSEENSEALGKGFRLGLLGPLHAEVVVERLEREYNLELVTTAPNVSYKVKLKHPPRELIVKNISLIPADFAEILEPKIKSVIFTPEKYLGEIFNLCQDYRGEFLNMEFFEKQVKLDYKMPLSEIIRDFFPKLKSVSSGYASFDYNFLGYEPFDGQKLDIYIGGRIVGALSTIVSKKQLYTQAKNLVEKLAKTIPRQMFEFNIQAAVGGRVISRITKKAWRKDVTAKLYGGDQTRKDKLLKKQKKGKKKLKAIGKVYIPQEAFMEVLKK